MYLSESNKNKSLRLKSWAMVFYVALCFSALLFSSLTQAQAPAVQSSRAAPQRIVSLAPHATELLFSAGLGARVVGVSESCDFPERVKALPKVSNYRGTNVEAVLALRPDLVVAWPSGNKADDIAAIERLGIRVYRSEVDSLAGIANTVREFSKWSDDKNDASAAVTRAGNIDADIKSLREKFATKPTMRVFYQLGDGRLFTLSNKHLIGEALAVCGAKNIFGELAIPAPEVSRESVIAAKPDVIVLASASAREAVAAQWKNSPLAATPLVVVDGSRLHRPTLRTIDALREMCEAIDRVRK
jgi:ABC-type Fe3+-hydroxamate transport system substrate-binding protein